MNGRTAKKLRRSAEAATVGKSIEETKLTYKKFKKIYKGFKQRGLQPELK